MDLILAKALELFRRRGFEVTTMRDIADAAGVATGAAYYYFESKEAMVAAHYHQVQSLHAAKAREELIGKEGLRERLASVVHVKLEILNDDREFLGALFRYTGEGTHSRCWKKHEDRTKGKRRALSRSAWRHGAHRGVEGIVALGYVACPFGDDPFLPP